MAGLLSLSICQGQVITTGAGNGVQAYNGDNIPATDASLIAPNSVTPDDSGNYYIADMTGNRVRKVDRFGIISTIAGNGYTNTNYEGGYSGDGGPADSAELSWPACVAIDTKHNLYIADAANNCIRKINSAGIISTYAGDTAYGFGGDGGPATAAKLFYPASIVLDAHNNLIIADCNNNRIRKVDTAGIITTIAGNGYGAGLMTGGYSGDGGPATAASLYSPSALAFDKTGNLLIADMNNNCIRRITPVGYISTIAGNDTLAGYNGDNIAATAARLCAPSGIATDPAGNIYIADGGNERIRKIGTDGIITTWAGDGTGGFSGDGGICTDAELFSPDGVSLDKWGNMYIADESNYRVRIIESAETGVKPPGSTTSVIAVFPNPASGRFIVMLPKKMLPADIRIYDAEGRQVFCKTGVKNVESCIDLSKSMPGNYLIEIKGNGIIAERKVVVE